MRGGSEGPPWSLELQKLLAVWKSSSQPHKSTQEPRGVFKAPLQDEGSCLDMPRVCPGMSHPHPGVPRAPLTGDKQRTGLTKASKIGGGGAELGAEKLLEFLGSAGNPDVLRVTEQPRLWFGLVWFGVVSLSCLLLPSPSFTRFPHFTTLF